MSEEDTRAHYSNEHNALQEKAPERNSICIAAHQSFIIRQRPMDQ